MQTLKSWAGKNDLHKDSTILPSWLQNTENGELAEVNVINFKINIYNERSEKLRIRIQIYKVRETKYKHSKYLYVTFFI